MSYYVLKHSAKGTTWGEHKYIRKEGNRYIYPEDVEGTKEERLENAIVGPDGDKKSGFAYNYLKLIDPEAAEDYLNEDVKKYRENVKKYRENLKNIDDVELVRMLQRLNKLDEMNDNRPASETDKKIKAAANIYNIKNAIKDELDDRRKRNKILSEAKTAADEHRAKEEHDSRAAQASAEKEAHLANAKKIAADEHKAKEEHDSRAAQAAAEKETYLKRAENKKKVENKRDRLTYIRNARKTRNRDKKYVVDTEDGGAFVTRNREKAVQVRNEVKQNKLKREDPIKYYLQRRKQKRK